MGVSQTPDNCNSNCASCSADCAKRNGAAPDFKAHLSEGCSVKKLIGVVSGKGGVGKSMVTSLLASGLNRDGYRVGVIDADITGPSIPRAFGLSNDGLSVTSDGKLMIPEKSANGVEIISANLLLENETDPIIWRGTLVAGAVKQFWEEVLWKDIDCMLVDMPPGTGDVSLTVFQSLPLDGIVIVTTPQELVSMIVEKAVKMAEKMNIPILGIIENMSWMECPHCGERLSIFGESRLEEVAFENRLRILARLPLEPKNAEYMDGGAVEAIDLKHIRPALTYLEEALLQPAGQA